MPYTKYVEPFDKARRLLKGYDLNAKKLAEILHCSEPTARERLRNPGRITTSEWLRISRRGHIPVEEIREAIFG